MSTRLFLDTNVVLDLLAHRLPFYESVAKIATLADQGKVTLVVSALSYSTVNYFLSKYENYEIAQNKLRRFRVISEVSDLNEVIIDKALNANFRDFEDALQYFGAIQAVCGVIITRNAKDFKASAIPVMTPDEYIASLHAKG